ncbi:hypothetical protein CORC01_08064 [Colletotrichum orchidophilum]|uniref:Uncharacterized protein n=1 Tax=Colletotrichum orchidophilum TaxID=1209926 RepID=A0A1G4B5D0_9PEZI|nr:uncharacterized protein CORC01_08064 [Colletotrichum orchidophilum]OHE96607.1 hypothetical protein CORC01_08064 [Colletotrichum orchidophilum]
MRTSTLFNALSAATVVVAGVMAMDLGDEMRAGWNMGLLPRQTAQNLQTFEGNLGGVQASAITKSNNPSRPFEVDGDTFPDFTTAAGRSCDNQKNKCSQAANNGPQKFEVTKCDEQAEQCKNAIGSISKQSFGDAVFSGTVGDFDIFCDP